MIDSTSNAKVLFRVPEEDGSTRVETLWATNLGGDQYRIDNSAFFAYGVSWRDIVLAPFDSQEGLPTFQKVVSKSGHRTVRVIFEPPVEGGNISDELLKGLVSLGCTYEGANPGYLSIDIPPEVDLEIIRQHLIDNHATWEHADPSYDELFPGVA
jgi:hypothetical protein